ncbi:uncharacterized protein [Bombus fervidus]|uniref:uncharacterized protein n=1 Tax=Bombus fervidus TaxID=203811 RepID=UPI003AB4308B
MRRWSIQEKLKTVVRNNRQILLKRIVEVVRVEGRNRSRGHVTVSLHKHQDVNRSGHVTKIELELMEAPDDTILVGPIPSELNITGEINSTYSDGNPELGAVILRAEEALIVIFVLFLWAAAIALFFNRWGKIRMLEPSQPKFLPQDEQNCTTIEQNQLQNRRTFSKCNILCEECPIRQDSNYALGQMRPRQNSAFIGSSVSFLPGGGGTARRTKSAFDLQFSVFTENNTLDSSSEQDTLKNFKPACDSTKLLLDERKTSVYQLDKTGTTKSFCRNREISVCQFDASPKLWQRDRGMSICHFDRTEVLARPLQRDRGASICQFDRMDVLARPLQRDRTGSAYHFDRMDVLARPNVTLDKSLLREKRVSMCNLLGKNEKTTEGIQMERHLSNSNVGKIGEEDTSIEEERGRIMAEEQKTFIKHIPKEEKNSFRRSNQSSCSQTSDAVFGYKGTCV